MKRYLGVVLAIVGVGAGVVFALKKFNTKTIEAERDANVARIKIDYLERVAWIRSNPDEKSYKEEVGSFMRWYFLQVNDHLNRFGGNKKFDDYLDDLDRRAEKGKESQLADKKAYFEYTKEIFEQFRAGTYEPVWSGSDKGIRIDVLSTKPTVLAGEQKIRYRIAVWGCQRELREDNRVRRMNTSCSITAAWKLFDEKGKLIGEMTAGDPSNKIDYPERFISWFPAQMVLGHYDIDLVPAEVKSMEITFGASSRSSTGGDIQASATWKLDSPAEWRLAPGQAWKDAQESVRPEEEIDPSKKQGRR